MCLQSENTYSDLMVKNIGKGMLEILFVSGNKLEVAKPNETMSYVRTSGSDLF